MADIYCIRHGQASFAAADYDQLSETGYRQSHLLGKYLLKSGVVFDRIYAGTLKRQIQTAETAIAVCRDAGMRVPELVCDARWNELQTEEQVKLLAPKLQLSDPIVGSLLSEARHDKKAFQKLIRATFDYWINQPELSDQLEPWVEARQRVVAALGDVHRQNGSGNKAAVFTSGGIIAIIAAHTLKLPPRGVYPLFEKVINCSISRLLHNADNIALSTFNEHAFLTAMAEPDDKHIITYR